MEWIVGNGRAGDVSEEHRRIEEGMRWKVKVCQCMGGEGIGLEDISLVG